MTNVSLNGELYNKKEARVSQLMLMRAASQGKKKKKAHFKHYTFIFLYFGRKGLKISNLELAQCCIHLENNCRFRAQIQRLEICSPTSSSKSTANTNKNAPSRGLRGIPSEITVHLPPLPPSI